VNDDSIQHHELPTRAASGRAITHDALDTTSPCNGSSRRRRHSCARTRHRPQHGAWVLKAAGVDVERQARARLAAHETVRDLRTVVICGFATSHDVYATQDSSAAL
jgi:hypothetical protein